jgi:DNA-binding transcriptional MerR regulator
MSRVFSFSELAQEAGISAQALILYRDHGLLQEPRRQRGRSGVVAYHEEHLTRLQFIARAFAYGFTMDDVAEFISSNLVTCGDAYRIAERRRDYLKMLVGSDAPATLAIGHLMARCSRTGGRRTCAILSVLSDNSRDSPGSWERAGHSSSEP